jgi:hypothetical protein
MKQDRTVNIEIGKEEWEGIYSNFVIITHSPSEFILDFSRMLPGAKKAKVFSRIIMTPQNARALLATLENNIEKFEAEHGPIPALSQDPNKGAIGFQSEPEPDKKMKH